MTTYVHETAILGQGVELGTDVVVGPHCVIGEGTRIGDGTEIGPQATIGGGVSIGSANRIGPKIHISGLTRIGDENKIFGQASLGTEPQDLSYEGEPTWLEMGDRNTVREFVTINRGTVKGGGVTSIGSDCLLMACCHVAHDCEVADRVIMGNNVLLAGHVVVESRANIGGGAVAQQFVTVGTLAYVGGVTRMPQDVPPYMILEGNRPRVRGANVVGLKRADSSPQAIEALKDAYKSLFRPKEQTESKQTIFERLMRDHEGVPEMTHLIDFMRRTGLGQKGRYRETLREEFGRQGKERMERERQERDGQEPLAPWPRRQGAQAAQT